MKFGAIDIGTNAARLLIGEVCQDDGHSYIKKLSYTRLPPRLGGDVFEFGEITPKKEEEFIKTMKAFQLIADIFDVKELRACATSAMREAKNGEKVAKSISKNTHAKTGEQRKALHVAAVFVCNFTNHLYQIGNEICLKNSIPFEILHPLIKETAEKLQSLSPSKAQTGPAVRNDQKTIEKHIDFLTNENQKEIYKILTKSIQNGEKL